MRVEWARNIRDTCLLGGVPFFFKQWGAIGSDGVRRSKGANGHLLDDRVWQELPE